MRARRRAGRRPARRAAVALQHSPPCFALTQATRAAPSGCRPPGAASSASNPVMDSVSRRGLLAYCSSTDCGVCFRDPSRTRFACSFGGYRIHDDGDADVKSVSHLPSMLSTGNDRVASINVDVDDDQIASPHGRLQRSLRARSVIVDEFQTRRGLPRFGRGRGAFNLARYHVNNENPPLVLK